MAKIDDYVKAGKKIDYRNAVNVMDLLRLHNAFDNSGNGGTANVGSSAPDAIKRQFFLRCL